MGPVQMRPKGWGFGSVLLALVLAGVIAGTGVSTSVASAGARPSAEAIAAKVIKDWRGRLLAGAVSDPGARFSNPSLATLRSRLRIAAARYDFRVARLQVFHPLQSAPLIVVESKRKHHLASSTAAILRSLGLRPRALGDRPAYEGFLFAAVDSSGAPFLAAFSNVRGAHPSGGQWASDPTLYPLPREIHSIQSRAGR